MRFSFFNLVCCIFSFSLVSFAQDSKNGLIAHFYFNDGTTANECGSPAKAVGVTFCEDRFGNENSACYFYGNAESYLNLGTSEDLKPVQGSISVWFKMNNYLAVGRGIEINPIILTKNQVGDDFYEAYCVYCEFKTHKITVNTTEPPENQVNLVSKTPALPDEWHQVVMTFSNQLFCLYIDGVLEGSVRKNFRTIYLKDDSVVVGNTANEKNKRFFFGTVDDISIYNRVLSQEEVTDLYNEPNPNRLYNILRIVFIILLNLLGLWIIIKLVALKFSKDLLKEKEKNNMLRQMYELEVKVIKAQMNPHFIFNSMNSIQQFILTNDNEKANTYLIKFSRLLRKILETSTDEYISLDMEIDILKKYIEIESLRFEHTLNYEVIVEGKTADITLRIPQMLVQPFVENAIWHGLLLKDGSKNLKVTFMIISEKQLLCTIDDNGIGRQPVSQKQFVKRKSLGIHITRQRLELMQKEWESVYDIEIKDKKDDKGNSAGTCVNIKMPFIKN
ncbi:MAG: histidine kinase [Bacteroidia bacterium]